MYILVYVRQGCIDRVKGYPTVDEAIKSFNLDDMKDPEGDDLAVYSGTGDMVAGWFPEYNEEEGTDGYWNEFEEV